MEMNGTRSNIIVYGGNDTSLVYNAGSNSGSYSTDCGINASAMYLTSKYACTVMALTEIAGQEGILVNVHQSQADNILDTFNALCTKVIEYYSKTDSIKQMEYIIKMKDILQNERVKEILMENKNKKKNLGNEKE